MEFSRNLRKRRKGRGLSQKALAEAIGVVQGCVANWESGTREPRLSEVAKISAALGVGVSELTGVRMPPFIELYDNSTMSARKIPMFSSRISAGFPSPADDYIEDRLDLNDLLIKDTASTFFVRVSGESMTGAGILDGDILIVDKSKKPVNKSIVIAVLDGELTVKRIQKSKGTLYLAPENDEFQKIQITEEMEFIVWGVVTNVIHPL